MSDFAKATEQDEEWPNKPPFVHRAGGQYVAVLFAPLAERSALITMGAWITLAGYTGSRCRDRELGNSWQSGWARSVREYES